MMNLDLNFSAKEFDKIVPILHEWIIDEIIDWEECEKRLQALKIDQEVIDWLMDVVNTVSIKDVGQKILQEIEEENMRMDNYYGIGDYANEEIF